jgi:hypothetical protein
MKSKGAFWKSTALVLVLLAFGIVAIGLPASAGPIAALATPIPIPTQTDARPVPVFIGHEAAVKPIAALPVPDNPHMSPGSWSNFPTTPTWRYLLTAGPSASRRVRVIHLLRSQHGAFRRAWWLNVFTRDRRW